MLGEYKQLNIFEAEYETKVKSRYETIKKKLSKYSIDKIYDKEFKGQNAILHKIHERLVQQSDYEDYMKDLVDEMLKLFPIIERNYKFDKTGIWQFSNENYGYQVTKVLVDGLSYNAMSGPLYCLDMIPKQMLGVD